MRIIQRNVPYWYKNAFAVGLKKTAENLDQMGK
jgi:hypothetical protein